MEQTAPIVDLNARASALRDLVRLLARQAARDYHRRNSAEAPGPEAKAGGSE